MRCMGLLREVRTTDYHTAGEPFRIVTSELPGIPGATVPERREYARQDAELDAVRRLLCHEPRGHADMYGCFLVPPDDGGAHLGALFWHKDGFSTACGHGTIALGAWAVESGRVPAPPDGDTDVVVDVPSGRVTARVSRRAGVIERIAFRNVPSYVLARDVTVRTTRGPVRVDLGYGGAIYASLPARSVGLAVLPECYTDLIAVGREVQRVINRTQLARHPTDPRLSGVYGTILYDDLGTLPDKSRYQRSVTIFADGEVDRSPCGSGTCARLAILAAEGALGEGEGVQFTHDSIIGTRFVARVLEQTTVDGRPAVVPEVEGAAYRTGEHTFLLDERDPLATGFVLR
jgi:proline racemase